MKKIIISLLLIVMMTATTCFANVNYISSGRTIAIAPIDVLPKNNKKLVAIKHMPAGYEINQRLSMQYDSKNKDLFVYCDRIKPYKIQKHVVKRQGKKIRISWDSYDYNVSYQVSRTINKNETWIAWTTKAQTALLKDKGKRWYKVRAFKVRDGKRIYGQWSESVKL